MEIKKFLEQVSTLTLINFSLCKRLLPNTEKKELKAMLKECAEHELLTIHEYENLRCYSLSTKGFAQLGIQHQPKLHFHQHQADIICRCNHVRIGFEQSLEQQSDIYLDKWISGSKFHQSPFSFTIKKNQQILKPNGAAIIGDNENNHKVFFIHYYQGNEELNHAMFLYNQLEQKRYHQKRFFLNESANVRVIILIDNNKAFFDNKVFFKKELYQNALFLTLGHCHYENLLHQEVFIDIHGNHRSIMHKSP